jgi:hypothetical protein
MNNSLFQRIRWPTGSPSGIGPYSTGSPIGRFPQQRGLNGVPGTTMYPFTTLDFNAEPEVGWHVTSGLDIMTPTDGDWDGWRGPDHLTFICSGIPGKTESVGRMDNFGFFRKVPIGLGGLNYKLRTEEFRRRYSTGIARPILREWSLYGTQEGPDVIDTQGYFIAKEVRLPDIWSISGISRTSYSVLWLLLVMMPLPGLDELTRSKPHNVRKRQLLEYNSLSNKRHREDVLKYSEFSHLLASRDATTGAMPLLSSLTPMTTTATASGAPTPNVGLFEMLDEGILAFSAAAVDGPLPMRSLSTPMPGHHWAWVPVVMHSNARPPVGIYANELFNGTAVRVGTFDIYTHGDSSTAAIKEIHSVNAYNAVHPTTKEEYIKATVALPSLRCYLGL